MIGRGTDPPIENRGGFLPTADTELYRGCFLASLLLYIFHSVSSAAVHPSAGKKKEDTGNVISKGKGGWSVCFQGWVMTAGWAVDLFWSEAGRDQTAHLCLCREREREKGGGRTVGAPAPPPLPPITATRRRWCRPHQTAWTTRGNSAQTCLSTACIIQKLPSFNPISCGAYSFLKSGWKSAESLKSDATNSTWIECVSVRLHIYVPHKKLLSVYSLAPNW